jgi:hypothetical protein
VPEVQSADPGARRRALVVVVLGTIVGSASITGFERIRPRLADWMSRHPEEALRWLTLAPLVLFFGVTVPTLGIAIYSWRLAARVIATGRFPPPGFAVVRDTVVLKERAAIARGRLFQVLAAILAVAACLVPWFAWRVGSLARHAGP